MAWGSGTVGIGDRGDRGPWGIGDRGGSGASCGLELLTLFNEFTPFGEAVDKVSVSGGAFKIFFG